MPFITVLFVKIFSKIPIECQTHFVHLKTSKNHLLRAAYNDLTNL